MYIWHTAASSNINILYFTCLYFQTLYITESVEVISLFFPVSLGTNFPLSKLPLWIRYLNLQILYTHTYTHTHTHTHTHTYIYTYIHTHTHTYTQMVKNLPSTKGNWVQSPGWEDPLEKRMAIHSSILAWKISWT